MAKKISELTELTAMAKDDVLPIIDTSASETKKIKTTRLIVPFPDIIPASPNTEDDEFNSTSLDAKWTENTDATSHDHDTTWPSCIYANFTANQQYTLSQDYAPAGAFSLTGKFHVASANAYQQGWFNVFDSDESDGIQVNFGYVATAGHNTLGLHSKDATTWTYNRKSLVLPSASTYYLHIQRDGSNNWGGWISFDGYSFWLADSVYSKTFTVHHFQIGVTEGGSTVPLRAGFDWIRRDWVTL